jgi:CRP-like cAMP-binding protein
MHSFKNYLLGLGQLSEDDWLFLQSIQEETEVKSGVTFLRADHRSQNEIFILKGIVRAYFTDKEGNDRTTAFFSEGNFMSTNTFRTDDGLSVHNYQALTDAIVLKINSSRLKEFFSGTKLLTAIGFSVKEAEKERLKRRDLMLLDISGEKKYRKFLEEFPDLENQVSHKYIASYLGITPVSLSRIRKRTGRI